MSQLQHANNQSPVRSLVTWRVTQRMRRRRRRWQRTAVVAHARERARVGRVVLLPARERVVEHVDARRTVACGRVARDAAVLSTGRDGAAKVVRVGRHRESGELQCASGESHAVPALLLFFCHTDGIRSVSQSVSRSSSQSVSRSVCRSGSRAVSLLVCWSANSSFPLSRSRSLSL